MGNKNKKTGIMGNNGKMGNKNKKNGNNGK